jgi:hypothetical protein
MEATNESEKNINGYHGHCYCGNIKFCIDINVIPNKPVFCHCESCRRAHAAPLYQVVYIPKQYYKIIEGEEYLKEYSRQPDSVIRSFCSNCGSRIKNELPLKPELGIGFFPALLEEEIQHNLPDIFKPIYHYCSHESVLDMNIYCNDGLDRK